jgi:hypothetical protein
MRIVSRLKGQGTANRAASKGGTNGGPTVLFAGNHGAGIGIEEQLTSRARGIREIEEAV